MKKLLGKIFNRAVVVVVLIVLQVVWLCGTFLGLADYAVWINAAFTALSVLMVLLIDRKDLNPAYKIVWIILCCLAPLFGGMMYLMFGDKRPSRDMRRRMEKSEAEHRGALYQQPGITGQMEPRLASTAHYLERQGPYPAWDHTASAYFPLGDEMFVSMLADLEHAERFIFLEYFLISEGEMWEKIYAVLRRKAESGVRVRLIYDDVGCVAALPRNFFFNLEKNGIECLPFNPMLPVLALVMNHRDHRKMLIVDGRIGYTGGINLADEYINKKQRFGHWKDSGVRLEGAAVWNMTVAFLNLWNAFRPTDLDYEGFRPACGGVPLPETDGIVQPYMDSPLDEELLSENVYLDILAQAQQSVYIFTPYLIIDNEMATALRLSAKRGVDVRIVTPGIPDKRLVYRLTRSYYAPLLRDGVRIYEYTPGFLHAKSFVSDGRRAVVGTINLDYRSLYLHFECGVLFDGGPVVRALSEDCRDTFACSREVTLRDCRTGFFGSLFDDVLRLLSPLL